MDRPYQVEMSKAAVRGLASVDPKKHREQVRDKILTLEVDPRPPGFEPVKSQPGHFRVRQGDWRVIYSIDDAASVVKVDAVRRRNEDTY